MTNNTTSDDHVTITEALKRLGEHAPARQSFYEAINRGDIREVTDQVTGADGKRFVSWTSVQEYVGNGGFPPRRGRSPETSGKLSANPPEEGPATPVADHDRVSEDPESSEDPIETLADPPPAPEHALTPATSPMPSPAPARASTRTQAKAPAAKPAPVPRPSVPKRKKPSVTRKTHPPADAVRPPTKESPAGGIVSKGSRRTPSLRILKNSLRHLDFEGTKAIRDWADNRLLTVLRPSVPADTGAETATEAPTEILG